MIRGYKMRLLPSKDQVEVFKNWQARARAYHNFVLFNQTKYDNRDIQLNLLAAGGSLYEARKSHWPLSFLAACNNDFQENGYNAYQNGTNIFKLPSGITLGVLKNLAAGWTRFFDFKKSPSKYPALLSAKNKKCAQGKNVYNFGKPKFFAKNEFPNIVFLNCCPKISGEGRKQFIKVPTLGNVKFITDRNIPIKIKQFTIQEICGKWYLSIIADDEKVARAVHGSDEKIGIDMGVRHFVTKSDGAFMDIPGVAQDRIAKADTRIKRLQKKLARQTKFGKNWNKTKQLIAATHFRKTEISNAFIHQVSKELTDNYCEIIREDLKISNMVKSAAGTIDEPGINVAAKSGLNRSILQQGWGKFFVQLEYKSLDKGGKVTKVNPRFTSRICPSCGHEEADNRKDEKFKCKKCNYSNHADKVGAINILNRGLLGDSLSSPARVLGRNSDAHTSCENANVPAKAAKKSRVTHGSRKRSLKPLKTKELN